MYITASASVTATWFRPVSGYSYGFTRHCKCCFCRLAVRKLYTVVCPPTAEFISAAFAGLNRYRFALWIFSATRIFRIAVIYRYGVWYFLYNKCSLRCWSISGKILCTKHNNTACLTFIEFSRNSKLTVTACNNFFIIAVHNSATRIWYSCYRIVAAFIVCIKYIRWKRQNRWFFIHINK